MNSPSNDRWLWVALSAFLVVAIKGMQYAIKDTVHLIELDPEQYDHSQTTEGKPEDTVSISTLRTLIASPNQSIAEAAASLAINRLARDPTTIDLIVKDLGSRDKDARRKATQLVRYLDERDENLGLGTHDLFTPQGTYTVDDTRFRRELDEHPLQAGHPTAETGIVSTLEELDPLHFPPLSSMSETYQPGTAPFAGWDTIPTQRPAPDEDAYEMRRRRREAMVVQRPRSLT